MADPIDLVWDPTGLLQSARRQRIDLDLFPGEGRPFRFTPPAPVDISGYTFELRIARAAGVTPAVSLTVGSGIAAEDEGVILGTVTAAHSAMLAGRTSWVGDLWVLNSGSELCVARWEMRWPAPIGGPASLPAPPPIPPTAPTLPITITPDTLVSGLVGYLYATGGGTVEAHTGVALLGEPNTFSEPNTFEDDVTCRGDIRLAGGVVQRIFATDSGTAIVFPTIVAAEVFDAPRLSHFNEALFESVLGKEPTVTLRAKPLAEYTITQFQVVGGTLTIWLSDDAGLLQHFKQAHYSDGYADQYAMVRITDLRPDLDGDHQVTNVLMAPGRLQVAVPGMPDEGPTGGSGTASTLQNGPLARQVDAHGSTTGEWYATGEYYSANGNTDYWHYPGGPGGSWGDGPSGFYFGFYDPILTPAVDVWDILRLNGIGSTGITIDPELNDPDDYLVTVGALKAYIQSLLEE